MKFPLMTAGTLIAERFEIEGLAARGGMGLIYRARDRETKQPVALKVLLPEAREHGTERLLREAQVLSELRHPGIAAYLGHGRLPEGQIFLAMEWVQGEDLAKRLE
ncbi:MAG TPA: protein kinase, partial [Polyangia bacterium]|nr:protein kinase [Polyangia bacterium]